VQIKANWWRSWKKQADGKWKCVVDTYKFGFAGACACGAEVRGNKPKRRFTTRTGLQ
jgi:hypothetical protein